MLYTATHVKLVNCKVNSRSRNMDGATYHVQCMMRQSAHLDIDTGLDAYIYHDHNLPSI